MRLKVIACEVLTREFCFCTARSPHVVDLEFTPKDAHENSHELRALIQAKIDATPAGVYDAILLGYGLCGNGTVGLTARATQLVLPRAHDCCTLFLGSRRKFKEHFSHNPSQPFTSVGYMERGESEVRTTDLREILGLNRTFQEYAALYGEENARYIMETLQPAFSLETHGNRVVFIRVPETDTGDWASRFREKAEHAGKEFVELEGSIDLICRLVNGEWNHEEFLVVPPGRQIEGVYDWDEICRLAAQEGE